jgi:hypothetical protein
LTPVKYRLKVQILSGTKLTRSAFRRKDFTSTEAAVSKEKLISQRRHHVASEP